MRNFQSDKDSSLFYRAVRWLVWFFAPKFENVGQENIPDEPCIFVGNHSQMYGPIVGEIYVPGKRYIWCIGEMMDRKEVPAYAYQDFWSKKPKYIRWFFKILSYIIALPAQAIFRNADTIPVYHDARLRTTYRESIEKLSTGYNLVIFPEEDRKRNNIVYEFQDKFIDVAKLYYRSSHKEVSFVPVYLAPRLKKIYYGKPIKYHADTPISEERARISNELMDSITDMAVSLPEHTVVPYANIPKRLYPKNIPLEMKSDAPSDG